MKSAAFFLMFGLALLTACSSTPPAPVGSTTAADSGTTASSDAHLLGLVEATISTDGQLSNIRPVQDGLSPQAAVNLLSNFTFTVTSSPTILKELTARSRRFIRTGYSVKNNSTSAVNNLTLVAVNRANNLGGTAFSAITLSNGSKVTDANLARSILPTHGMQYNADTIQVDPLLASLQVLPASETAALTDSGHASGLIAPANTVLDYGFTVRKVNSSTPGTLGAGETGSMALAFSSPFPLPSPFDNSDIVSVTLTFAVVTDDALTFTESLEQQSETAAQLDAALLAQTNRTAAELRKLPGSARGTTINGKTYPAATYLSARTALSVSDFPRQLILTKAPRGLSVSSSNTNVTAEGDITLTATVEQSYAPVSNVVFLKDGGGLNRDTTAPFTGTTRVKTADNGKRNYGATMYDALGNESTATVGVSVNIPLPFGVKQFGTKGYDIALSTKVDSKGNVYATGQTAGTFPGNTSAGGNDIFITKYDSSGTLVFTKQFGTVGDDYANGIAVDSYGEVYVTGQTSGTFSPGNISAGSNDIFIAKYSLAGKQRFIKQFGTAGDDSGTGIAVDSNNNVYVTGSTSDTFAGNTNAGNYDAFITKYDLNGTQLFVKQFGTAGNDFAYGIALDSGGNVYTTGNTDGTFAGTTRVGKSDAFLVKFDSSGTQQFARQFGTAGDELAYGIAVDSSGNAYVAGQTYGTFAGGTNAGDQDAFIAKYNSSGTQQFTRQFGTAGDDQVGGVAVDSGGNAYVTGYTYGTLAGNTSAGDYDAFIVKYDSSGAVR